MVFCNPLHIIVKMHYVHAAYANGHSSKYLLRVGIAVGHFIDAHIYSWRIQAIKYACVYFQDEEWKSVWGLIDIFLRPAKKSF